MQQQRLLRENAFAQGMRIDGLLCKLTGMNSGNVNGASRCKAGAARRLLHSNTTSPRISSGVIPIALGVLK